MKNLLSELLNGNRPGTGKSQKAPRRRKQPSNLPQEEDGKSASPLSQAGRQKNKWEQPMCFHRMSSIGLHFMSAMTENLKLRVTKSAPNSKKTIVLIKDATSYICMAPDCLKKLSKRDFLVHNQKMPLPNADFPLYSNMLEEFQKIHVTEWGIRLHFSLTFEIRGHFLGSAASTG